MPVLELARATWTEVRDQLGLAPVGRRVAILPLGATEAHGPHLALGADVTIVVAMARAGAQRLAQAGWTVLVLPALAYAPAPWAAALPGTVGPSSGTFRALVAELIAGAAGWGVDVVAVANAHFDPTAVLALRSAVAEQVGAGIRVAFPDPTRRKLAQRLGEEFASGACHAGRYETSIVLAEEPAAVRREVAACLAARDVSLTAAMAAGADDFASAGAPDAWVGRPAEASAAEGRERVEELGRILEECVVAAMV